MDITSQDDPALHPEAACQQTAVSSPTSLQRPFLPQCHMMSFEEELSDENNSGGSTELCHRTTKSHLVAFERDGTLLDVAGDGEDVVELQWCGRDDKTKIPAGNLSQCVEGTTVQSASPANESVFIPFHSSCDLKPEVGSEVSNSGKNSLNCANETDGQRKSQHSPKTEHKGATTTEAPNLLQHRNESLSGLTPLQPPSHVTPCITSSSATADSLPPQHCVKGDVIDLVGLSTINTVTLCRSEDESFGLDVEVISSPLKVVITGIKPGGTAERVCLVFIIMSVDEYLRHNHLKKKAFDINGFSVAEKRI